VAEVDLHPIYFQLYVSIGVFITCFLFAAFLPLNDKITNSPEAGTNFTFVPLAFPCGVLFVLSILFSFLAIPRIGLALGQGVWGGCAIITSFLLGSYKNGSLGNAGLAGVAIALLLVGVAGITFCEAIGSKLSGGKSKSDVDENSRLSNLSVGLETGLIQNDEDAKASFSSTLAGLGYALLVGLAGGSTLFPMEYADADQQGLVLLPAFGVGALTMSLAVFGGFVCYQGVGDMPPMHVEATLRTGLFSGLLWNVSNVLAIYSIPRIGLSVAYPMLQCALFVAGLWGIFVFKEIRSAAAIGVFFLSGAILIGGAGCLAVSQAD
jgi:hypothetical protein